MKAITQALFVGALQLAFVSSAAAETDSKKAESAAAAQAEAERKAALIDTAKGKLTVLEAEALAQQRAEDKAGKDFAGLSLGAGLSVTFDIGHNDRVDEAVLVGPTNIVRVSKRSNVRARVMFESHYFATTAVCPLNGMERGCGFGPFVAIQPGTDDVIEAAALGIMFGVRRVADKPESFNIGFGFIFDPKTRILGDGIVANSPLPAGETDVRYQEREQKGIVVLTSFSF